MVTERLEHQSTMLRCVPALEPEPEPRPGADRRAFQRAFSQHRRALSAHALRLTRNRSDAEDLLQEMSLRAWRYWPLYREQDNCRAWLQRIMLNTFCSERRAYARKKRLLASYALAQDAASEASSAEAVASGDPQGLLSSEHVSLTLSALKPEQARILRLVDMDERSYREAAAELECPVGTVMSRLHRARRALRSLLDSQALDHRTGHAPRLPASSVPHSGGAGLAPQLPASVEAYA